MTRREALLDRLKKFGFVPGHAPNIENKNDNELERYVSILESTFESAFGEEEHGQPNNE